MITAGELLEQNEIEGDVLFLVNKNTELPTQLVNLHEPGHTFTNRSYDFVLHPLSRKYNDMFDLSNRIKNTMVRPSSIIKQNFDTLSELSNKYAIVYIDAEDNQIENILRGIDKKLVDKALIVCKSVDFSAYYDYIKEYNSILPNVTSDGFIKWRKKKVLELNKLVYRDFSNNF